MSDKLVALTEKWAKAKSKLQKFQAKELDLRLQIDLVLSQAKKTTCAVSYGTDTVTFTRNENYSIPKSAIPDIKSNIPKDVFDEAFTTSYKIKPAVYNNLSGDCKKSIERHLTVKPAPLSVRVKEA